MTLLGLLSLPEVIEALIGFLIAFCVSAVISFRKARQ